MKLTGTVLLIIGALTGAFTLFQYLLSSTSQTPEAANASVLPMMQFLFAGIMLVTGGLLTVYGGRGIIQTKNPAIRN